MNNEPAVQPNPGFALRLLVTLGVPLLLLVAAELLPLPGVSTELLRELGGSRAQLGVFALGVTPILSAYVLVELVAFFVPRWSRLRHDFPEGRQRLDAIAQIVALVLAVVQAYGIALFVESLGEVSVDSSRPVVMASLVAGVMVQLWVARAITRYGFLNGLVALSVSGLAVELLESALRILHLPSPFGAPKVATATPLALEGRGIALTALALLVTITATWIALRSRPRAGDDKAQALAGAPWIPVPSGSFQAYVVAASLIGLLLAFAPASLEPERLKQEHVLLPLTLALVMIISWALTQLMHRPAELAPLVQQLGGKADAGAFREATRSALRAPLWPTLAFLTTAVLAQRISLLGIVAVVSLIAVAMDLAHAIRLGITNPNLVPVWEERRIAAVPLLRAALAEAKIASETRGAYVVSLWQLFVPYAPVELLVVPSDAERAGALLRALATEKQNAPSVEQATVAPSPHVAAPRRRTGPLSACAFAAAVLYAASFAPTVTSTAEPGSTPVRLEVVRIDDTIDPFVQLSDLSLEPKGRISIARERTGYSTEVRYAQTPIGTGEAAGLALERLRTRLKSIQLPTGARFGYGAIASEGEETQSQPPTPNAVRSYVLLGASVVGSEDVADAVVMASPDAELPDVYLAITLTAEGARRFAEMTTEWTQRRVAFIVDGEVISAPLVMEPINGGMVSLTSPGSYATKLAQAQLWERGLKPR